MGKLRVINSSTSDRLNYTVTYCTAVIHQCMDKENSWFSGWLWSLIILSALHRHQADLFNGGIALGSDDLWWLPQSLSWFPAFSKQLPFQNCHTACHQAVDRASVEDSGDSVLRKYEHWWAFLSVMSMWRFQDRFSVMFTLSKLKVPTTSMLA